MSCRFMFLATLLNICLLNTPQQISDFSIPVQQHCYRHCERILIGGLRVVVAQRSEIIELYHVIVLA
jgi:hypothetical protein